MKRTLVLLALLMLAVPPARADDDTLRALKAMSVDQLLDIEVTSVSKRREPLAGAAASIYVITPEALRRSRHRAEVVFGCAIGRRKPHGAGWWPTGEVWLEFSGSETVSCARRPRAQSHRARLDGGDLRGVIPRPPRV